VEPSNRPQSTRAAATGGLLHTAPLALVVVGCLLVLREFVPPGLELPAIAAAALAAGFLVSAVAWLRRVPRRPDHVSAWDFAGALLLVGFAATILSQPEQLMQLAAK
jgi:hypothetical protein